MKSSYYILFCFTLDAYGSIASSASEDRRIESEQVSMWQAKLDAAKSIPAAARLDELWLGLRNLGFRSSQEGHSREVSDLYRAIQNEMLSIPGHARHFAEELEKERALLGEEIAFSLKPQAYILETLPHLPSPETISVLGELLYDDRDAAKIPYKDECGGMYGMRPNSVLAMEALERIGLRDPGIEKPLFIRPRLPEDGDKWTQEEYLKAEFEQRNLQRQENLRPWKKWFANVKSGKIPFSFKGQAVEFRFKVDGSWETIPIANPPDDAPEVPDARLPATRSVMQKAKEPPPGNVGKAFRPYLFAGLAGLLALAAAWFGLRRMKSRA